MKIIFKFRKNGAVQKTRTIPDHVTAGIFLPERGDIVTYSANLTGTVTKIEHKPAEIPPEMVYFVECDPKTDPTNEA